MIGNNVYGGGNNLLPYITSKANTVVNVESGNSITNIINVKTGDVILALVMYRDINSLTITGNGWTKIIESPEVQSSDTNLHHKCAFYKKTATTTATESVTFTQSSANRMQLILVAFNNVSDIQYDSYYNINHTGTNEDYLTKPFYQIPKKTTNDYIIYGATSILWSTTQPDDFWQIKNNSLYIIQNQYTNIQSRLCLIDNIIGNEQYEIKATPNTYDISFVLIGVKLIPKQK